MATDPATQTVDTLMTTRVVTIPMDVTLGEIQDLFRQVRFHHLLVTEQHRLVGVISDRDLLKALSPFVGTLSETTRDMATLSKPAHQIMARHPVIIQPTCTLQDASQRLLTHGISCLPVVSAEGKVVGIVTWKDILKGLLNDTPTPQPAV